MPGSDVIILFGGDGNEHRVSVASAQNVATHLPGADLFYWSRSGPVLAVTHEALIGFERPFERDFEPAAPLREWSDIRAALDAGETRDRVFFLALHGGSGENGTIQRWLEERDRAFTGSGSGASQLAFDKVGARDAVSVRGIDVAEAEIVTADAASHEKMARLFETHGKLVLKPVADGSSHGMRLLETERDLDAAIVELRRQPETPYLAEAFIEGRELTIGVIDREHGPTSLPCSEVRLVPGRTFDYDGKYLGKGTEEITPAPIAPEQAQLAQSMARLAHEAVGCEGYSRTDVILSARGLVFLEINTLPGLTRASFIPQQLEAAAIPLTEFLERQITLARERLARPGRS